MTQTATTGKEGASDGERVGSKLQAMRKGSGLTRRELAGMAGVGTTTVARFERGEGAARLSTACKLTRALGCTLDELVR